MQKLRPSTEPPIVDAENVRTSLEELLRQTPSLSARVSEAVLTVHHKGVRRMIAYLSTRAGKTVIFSELARLARRQVLMLALREELLAQRAESEAAHEGQHAHSALEQPRVVLEQARAFLE